MRRGKGKGQGKGQRWSALQVRILKLIAEGYTNPQIAEIMGDDIEKMNGRVNYIYRKLGVRGLEGKSPRVLAIREAVRRGIIPCICQNGGERDA